ncbi:hypothetical protein DFQ30_011389, partial [Apophysomyces sp. BC1015]
GNTGARDIEGVAEFALNEWRTGGGGKGDRGGVVSPCGARDVGVQVVVDGGAGGAGGGGGGEGAGGTGSDAETDRDLPGGSGGGTASEVAVFALGGNGTLRTGNARCIGLPGGVGTARGGGGGIGL